MRWNVSPFLLGPYSAISHYFTMRWTELSQWTNCKNHDTQPGQSHWRSTLTADTTATDNVGRLNWHLTDSVGQQCRPAVCVSRQCWSGRCVRLCHRTFWLMKAVNQLVSSPAVAAVLTTKGCIATATNRITVTPDIPYTSQKLGDAPNLPLSLRRSEPPLLDPPAIPDPPNGISIGSAVLAQSMIVTNRQTHITLNETSVTVGRILPCDADAA